MKEARPSDEPRRTQTTPLARRLEQHDAGWWSFAVPSKTKGGIRRRPFDVNRFIPETETFDIESVTYEDGTTVALHEEDS